MVKLTPRKHGRGILAALPLLLVGVACGDLDTAGWTGPPTETKEALGFSPDVVYRYIGPRTQNSFPYIPYMRFESREALDRYTEELRGRAAGVEAVHVDENVLVLTVMVTSTNELVGRFDGPVVGPGGTPSGRLQLRITLAKLR